MEIIWFKRFDWNKCSWNECVVCECIDFVECFTIRNCVKRKEFHCIFLLRIYESSTIPFIHSIESRKVCSAINKKIKHNTFEIINSTERAHRIDWWTMQRKTPDVSMKDVCVHSSDDFCLCLQVERLNITKMICILCATSMVKLQCVQRVPIIIYWRTFCCWVFFFSCVCAVSTFFSFYLIFFHHSAEQPLAHFSLLLQL